MMPCLVTRSAGRCGTARTANSARSVEDPLASLASIHPLAWSRQMLSIDNISLRRLLRRVLWGPNSGPHSLRKILSLPRAYSPRAPLLALAATRPF